MRRAIAVIALALGLLASTSLPAGAVAWPPGVPYRSSFNGCVVDVISGDFGQSFGNVEQVGQSGCGNIRARVTAVVGGGTFTTPWCDLNDLLFHVGDPNTHPFYCTFLFGNGIIGLQAHIPGSSGWLRTQFVICGTVCSGIRETSLL